MVSGREFHRLSEDLRRRILSGDLALGDRLPSEPELALQYGVSRSTVREALRVLESQNLVVTTRGATGGSWINHPNREQIAGYLETGFRLMTLALPNSSSGLSVLTVEGLLEARAIIEVPAAELAAERRSLPQLHAMELALQTQEPNSEVHVMHRNFHDVIFEASGNALLATVSLPIYAVIDERFIHDRAPETMASEIADDHRRIYNAIRAKDVAEAGTAMREHLSHLHGVYMAMERTNIKAMDSTQTSSS